MKRVISDRGTILFSINYEKICISELLEKVRAIFNSEWNISVLSQGADYEIDQYNQKLKSLAISKTSIKPVLGI